MRLSNPERATLAEIGKRRKMLAEVTCVAKTDTTLAWYRKLVANKFDGSRNCLTRYLISYRVIHKSA
jgi:putative transposase